MYEDLYRQNWAHPIKETISWVILAVFNTHNVFKTNVGDPKEWWGLVDGYNNNLQDQQDEIAKYGAVWIVLLLIAFINN